MAELELKSESLKTAHTLLCLMRGVIVLWLPTHLFGDVSVFYTVDRRQLSQVAVFGAFLIITVQEMRPLPVKEHKVKITVNKNSVNQQTYILYPNMRCLKYLNMLHKCHFSWNDINKYSPELLFVFNLRNVTCCAFI